MTKNQISINEICVHLNRHYPVCLLSMIEIDPVDNELSVIFGKWFKDIWCLGNWTKDQIIDYCESTYEYSNIKYGNIKDIKDIKEESEFFIFVHNIDLRKLFDWKIKIFKHGYIAGDNKIVKPDININKYWILGVK